MIFLHISFLQSRVRDINQALRFGGPSRVRCVHRPPLDPSHRHVTGITRCGHEHVDSHRDADGKEFHHLHSRRIQGAYVTMHYYLVN